MKNNLEILIKCEKCNHKFEVERKCPICSTPVVSNINTLKQTAVSKYRKRTLKRKMLNSIGIFIDRFLGNK